MRKAVKQQDEISLQKMIEFGMQYSQLSEATKQDMRRAVAPVVKQYGDNIDPELFAELQQAIKQAH